MSEEKSLYAQFCAALKTENFQMPAEFAGKENLFNIFVARYRFANVFNGITTSPENEYEEKTLRGYVAGMRLFLAYNALELAANICANKKTKEEKEAWYAAMKIDGKDYPELLKNARDFLGRKKGKDANGKERKTFDKMLKAGLGREFAKYFRAFFNKENDDLSVFAQAVRIMFAHGYFTPSSSDLGTKANAELFQKLADIVLAKSRAMVDESLAKVLKK